MQRMLKFGSAKIPKLSKANLVNTEVHMLIEHINFCAKKLSMTQCWAT